MLTDKKPVTRLFETNKSPTALWLLKKNFVVAYTSVINEDRRGLAVANGNVSHKKIQIYISDDMQHMPIEVNVESSGVIINSKTGEADNITN